MGRGSCRFGDIELYRPRLTGNADHGARHDQNARAGNVTFEATDGLARSPTFLDSN